LKIGAAHRTGFVERKVLANHFSSPHTHTTKDTDKDTTTLLKIAILLYVGAVGNRPTRLLNFATLSVP
jgi:hypothetical protein